MGAATSSPKESPTLLSSSLLTFPLIEEEEEDDQQQEQHEATNNNNNNTDASIKITRAAKLYAFCAALNSCNLGYDIGVNTGGVALENISLDNAGTDNRPTPLSCRRCRHFALLVLCFSV